MNFQRNPLEEHYFLYFVLSITLNWVGHTMPINCKIKLILSTKYVFSVVDQFSTWHQTKVKKSTTSWMCWNTKKDAEWYWWQYVRTLLFYFEKWTKIPKTDFDSIALVYFIVVQSRRKWRHPIIAISCLYLYIAMMFFRIQNQEGSESGSVLWLHLQLASFYHLRLGLRLRKLNWKSTLYFNYSKLEIKYDKQICGYGIHHLEIKIRW